MSIVVETKNLKKIYGSKGNIYTALDDINLQINEGEFVGIMGPSGAGKSTLLNVISTIDKPTSGNISIGGENILNLNENALSSFRRNKLGFIFQDFNLLDTLTLKENIMLPLTLSKIKVTLIERRVTEVAEALGISNILEKYPYEVSGGQKQRTAAARAIITNPTLVLADEPTGALDSKSSKDLLQCLTDLNENINATIMMVTHDAFAASYCKRILFIKDGRLFTELVKGNSSRKEFFQKILDVLATIGN
ncbi:putative ABC transport system ATP-binding protein [Clostridium tetanomorphum]|uniref:ABC transporter ATP-binding protein n=1 Tax=Clostridium tetanomorphum TaxID=1553 RepID=A0A923E7E6_CLOTT|nr:ABC transporter ATP-binding protein [Clostridium tetanomorphum]KAJ49207.1 ABC transporter-like protein [Clostridium tetanomorphum DSM 665]KAJ51257.1 ABC transporter-like protein [Clostridium tetanomorphum DSM 665]MBC2397845.1 ABC transporter ATP-binding protein [Clostridium tetanomorphum]MBP1864843.1 putative ABC transport system ATP-binding protein [Clostridium tetanomorphum]NRS84019.1 putative ABC transport system ATP-binding protein [Clostridium tetanomorphum]